MTLPALNTDLASALAELDRPPRAGAFALEANRFRVIKRREARERAGIRKLIRPENAAAVVAHLPAGPEERTHALLRGDFVLCDMIPAIIAETGPLDHVRIATLGMSAANAAQLARLVRAGQIQRLTLVVSHYFQQVDRTTVFAAVCDELAPLGAMPIVTRNHAKVILLPALRHPHRLVIEGSANLRSSDNLEQVVIFNDQDTHDFHATWIDDLAAHARRSAHV
jgi:hypothetical protein